MRELLVEVEGSRARPCERARGREGERERERDRARERYQPLAPFFTPISETITLQPPAPQPSHQGSARVRELLVEVEGLRAGP